jgi:hypothetical protein
MGSVGRECLIISLNAGAQKKKAALATFFRSFAFNACAIDVWQ